MTPLIEEILSAIRNSPEVREAIRRELLTPELLELPERFAAFAEETNRRLKNLEQGQEELRQGQEELRQGLGEVRQSQEELRHLGEVGRARRNCGKAWEKCGRARRNYVRAVRAKQYWNGSMKTWPQSLWASGRTSVL